MSLYHYRVLGVICKYSVLHSFVSPVYSSTTFLGIIEFVVLESLLVNQCARVPVICQPGPFASYGCGELTLVGKQRVPIVLFALVIFASLSSSLLPCNRREGI